MSQFFIMLMSVVLIGLLAVAGANYIQPGVSARTEFREKTIASLQSASSAYRTYKISNRALPPVSTGEPDHTPWTNYFSKYAPSSVSVKYSNSGNDGVPIFYKDPTYGYNFCFIFMNLTEAQYKGIAEAANNFPIDSTVTPNQKTVVISTSTCGLRSDHASTAVPASWPSTVWVTLWLDYANAK